MFRLTKHRVLVVPNGMALAAAAVLIWGSAQTNADFNSAEYCQQVVNLEQVTDLAQANDESEGPVVVAAANEQQAPLCNLGGIPAGKTASVGSNFLNLSLLYLPAKALLGN